MGECGSSVEGWKEWISLVRGKEVDLDRQIGWDRLRDRRSVSTGL